MNEPVTDKLSIKSWDAADRPREKLSTKGCSALSDSELLAILIGSGSRNESAVELCKRILKSVNNNLNTLGKCTVSDLQKFKGIGEAKAITIVAALELSRRRKAEEPEKRDQITSSKDAYNSIKTYLEDLPHEEFWVLLLNRSNKIISFKKISSGGISGTVADVRIILKYAIELLASSLILCHNHPSGNKQPSQSDIDLTKKISNAAKLIDISVIDHLIVTDNSFFSFADEGIL